ncbi:MULTISPECIES: M20/M25/M40 family metallo-hydrolase [unclassified Fusibacter]|uniref:M20/M25/M40 family metallo-hydrolase n=1 Tax=unclassified Fusibacter TaxID=2624464 RepID=UPI001010D1A1|nr:MULTISPECIES: M20/M25/M40 family metallo-hydrolase [unclassified Fusibacter]MCK8058198.1 M20/M25/M40 family metallo-hydrolase [Fusibacter sp. A2]NPE20781.1 M20/M25/M40 family metallo-hydrolase [Fusibacter sp. A1]RXV62987.1 M20/M25/M40 family metallo-hydrolase [Fusibacter sp. A1]
MEVVKINKEFIKSVFYQLVSIRSDSNSEYENIIEDSLLRIIGQIGYFKDNNEQFGCYQLSEDVFNRSVVWALLKGESDKIIVLVNHHDAVDTADFGKLSDLAFRPDDLKAATILSTKNQKLIEELESDKWIIGRGTADMKGGVAIQLGVLEHFASLNKTECNILFLSVPDEETLSKGMLAAVSLMDEIKTEHKLEYQIMINSEPYFNLIKEKDIMHQGSVGKIMPVIYVRGIKSHISDPYSGMNPSLILSEIQRRTELNPSLCDVQGFDASPPPIWINLKDRKKSYDASIPEAAVGYFNWLTFSRKPSDVIKNLKMISEHSLMDVIIKQQQSYDAFCMMNHEESHKLEYEGEVLVFDELFMAAKEKGGDSFIEQYSTRLSSVKERLENNQINLPDVTVDLIEFVAGYLDIQGPAVIIGISGPYYPHITNELINNGQRYELEKRISKIAAEKYNITYQSSNYFMGMCDLSYAGIIGQQKDIDAIKNNSPGWDIVYKIPFEKMKKLEMPVLNLGPWGKDLHKTTERVFADDVFERIPNIMVDLIMEIKDIE